LAVSAVAGNYYGVWHVAATSEIRALPEDVRKSLSAQVAKNLPNHKDSFAHWFNTTPLKAEAKVPVAAAIIATNSRYQSFDYCGGSAGLAAGLFVGCLAALAVPVKRRER
jgi:hypothetical protein